MVKGQVPGKTKVTFYIVEDLARDLRVAAAYQGRRQSTLLEEALRQYLKGIKKKGRKEG